MVLERRPRFCITSSSGLGAGLQESEPCRLFRKLSIALTSVEAASPEIREFKLMGEDGRWRAARRLPETHQATTRHC